jgi:hypothetical protein
VRVGCSEIDPTKGERLENYHQLSFFRYQAQLAMGTQTERVPMYKDRMVVVVVVSAEITADGAVSLKELGRFAAEYPQEQ